VPRKKINRGPTAVAVALTDVHVIILNGLYRTMTNEIHFTGTVDPDCRIVAVSRKRGIDPTAVTDGAPDVMNATVKSAIVVVLYI